MAQFEFMCPQCGETIEADDSLCGQVAECPHCGKGIVVPHKVVSSRIPRSKLRPATYETAAVPPPSSAETMPRRMTEFERMAEKEAERRRKDLLCKTMLRCIKVAIVLVTLGGGFVWWNKTKMEERAAEQVAEREQAERKLRLLEEEKEKKDATVNALHAYLEREETRLKEVIEGAKIAQEAIDIDQKEFSEELEGIERDDARLAALSKKRREKRYDKAEYVMLILKSQELGKLYEKYCGEDLAAVRAKYEKEVNTSLKMHREATARYRKNKEKYFASVKGVDEEVEKKKNRASSKISQAANEAEQSLKDQLKRRARLVEEERKLKRDFQGPKVRQRLSEVTRELTELDEVIATTRALVTANKAQAAHMDATSAETSARRKYDTAHEVRQSADNDVTADMQHERDIFQLAGRYEQMTLDKLRTAMRISSEFQAAKAAEARRKLDFITRSTANLELMKADEIENVRKKIVARLAENVVDDDETKMQKPEKEQ